ncbi:hypothetical protein BS78_09G222100 [Paspalum vaginatum]|nr:hypothetical protein BS78_09G222100 [Paspalum vaginatum]
MMDLAHGSPTAPRRPAAPPHQRRHPMGRGQGRPCGRWQTGRRDGVLPWSLTSNFTAPRPSRMLSVSIVGSRTRRRLQSSVNQSIISKPSPQTKEDQTSHKSQHCRAI